MYAKASRHMVERGTGCHIKVKMMTKLKYGMLAVVLLVLLGLVAWQHQQIELLRTEGNDLRAQLAQATLLQDENERLTQQLKKAVEDSRSDQQELVRLRGQSSRLHQLEQENTQLKAERARMIAEAKQPQLTAAPAEPQQPVVSAQAPGTSPPNVTDLGVVEFSDGVPQRLTLGPDKECMVTATQLADGNLQMNFTSASEINGTPVQTEQALTLAPGRQFIAMINGVDVMLTPALKAK